MAGYFRLLNESDDIRRCPDAGENCGGQDMCAESSSGCRGTTSNSTEPCLPTLTGVFCRQCRDSDHHYVRASGDAKANCATCGATFWSTLGVAVGAVILIFTPKGRAVALCFRHLSNNNKKRASLLSGWLIRMQGIYRLDNKLKTLIGFYMIATKARVLPTHCRTHSCTANILPAHTSQ